MLKLVKLGGITKEQLTRGIIGIVLLIVIALVLGLVVVPKIRSN
jgi:hypothetical protein